MSAIRIVIVEDHPIFRLGLRELINQESDLEVCGEAEDAQEARKCVDSLKPDLIIVDLSLKESSGMEFIKEICMHKKSPPVLVLSMHDEAVHAQRCILAGARGYIMKQEASASVVEAIRHILSGNCYVSDNIMTQIVGRFRCDRESLGKSPVDALTDREFQVFQLIGRGRSSGEIAKRLGLSVKTVGTYRERIKEKLGLKHGSELVRLAVISSEDPHIIDPA